MALNACVESFLDDDLQGLAQRTPAWDESFAAMLVKVKPHGWYDSATQRVKAHVERAA